MSDGASSLSIVIPSYSIHYTKLYEQTYAHALLLSCADPTCIAPGDLDRIRFYLQRHVHLTRFIQAGPNADALQRDSQGLFVVSNSGHPPVALTRYRHPLQPGQWLLDSRELLTKRNNFV